LQQIDTFRVNGANLELSLQNDNQSVRTVPLSSIVTSGGGLTGNGVVNYLSQYNSTSTLDTTGIIWVGGRMGIGTNAPTDQLHTTGSVRLQNYPNTLNSTGNPVNVLSTGTDGLLQSHPISEVISAGGAITNVVGGTGISVSTVSGTATVTNTAPDQTVSITGAGINTVSGTYPNFTVTGTEVDGSPTNELQTLSTGTNTLTLSNGGGTVTVDTDPASDVTGSGANGQVSFWTGAQTQNGDNGLFWNNTTKRLGIGTNTPGQLLDIVSSGQSLLRIKGGTGTNQGSAHYFTAAGSSLTLFAYGDEAAIVGGTPDQSAMFFTNGGIPLKFRLGGSSVPAFTFTANGRLLAGTQTDDGFRLNIVGVSRFADNLSIGTTSSAARLHVVGSGSTSSTWTAQFHNSAGNNNALMIRNDGNVGVGTSSPNRTLQVTGEARITDLTTDTPTRIVGADADGDLGEITLGSGLSITSGVLNTSSTLNTGSGTAGQVTFWNGTNSITGNNNLWWDNTNARLGIGTNTPTSKLDVIGDVEFQNPTTSYDGGILGSELLSGAGATTGWTGTSFITGGFKHDSLTTPLVSTFSPANNQFYQVAIAVTGRTAGSFTFTFGGYTSSSLTASFTVGPLTTSTGALTITPTADFNGTITASVKVITNGTPTFIGKNSAGSTAYEERYYSQFTNMSLGTSSGRKITTGFNNVLLGYQAGVDVTTGINNVFLGYRSGFKNTIGDNNMFIGNSAGFENLSGKDNAFIGGSAGYANTSGIYNVAIGSTSLRLNTSGSSNIAIGYSAGYSSTGGSNVFIGVSSGYNTTSNNNLIIGTSAGLNNTTGGNNVLLGTDAGRFFGTGSDNATIISNSIIIGRDARPLANNQSNQIVIGDSGRGLGANTTRIGSGTNTIQTHLDGRLTAGNTFFDNNVTARISGLSNTASTYALWVTNSDGGTSTAIAPAFVVRNDGNVGIGIKDPSTKVHIVATNNQDGLFVSAADVSPFNAKIATFRYAGNPSVIHIEPFQGAAAIQARTTAGVVSPLRLNGAGGGILLGNAPSMQASAELEIFSTTKGILIPRMTLAQRDAITSPATGLQIYNTDSNVFQYYNGSSWTNVGGTGVTDLTFSGSSSPVTLNSSTGSDVTFVAGTNVSLSQSSNQLTINSSEVDGSVTNEGTLGVSAGATNTSVITSNTSGATGVTIQASTGLSISETTSSNGGTIVLTNSSPDQTVSLTGAGISSVTGTYPNFTITSTEVDGSTTNELQTLSTATNTVTLSNSGGSFTIAGAGINTVGTVGSTITVTGTEVDGSTTNEIQNLSLSGQSLGISSGTGVTLPVVWVQSGNSGISVSNTAGTFFVSNNAPNVTTNLTFSNNSSPVTLNSSDGTDVTFTAGTNVNFSQDGNNLTINSTEVDGSVSNEGVLGVAVGQTNSSIITSNSSTAVGVELQVSTGLSISESTATNGGTITLTNTGDTNPSDDITGSGATNYIPIFTGTNSVSFSSIYETGSNVGIGSITPTSRLVIRGAGSTNATSALRVNNSLDSTLLFIRNDGAVGFGTSNVNPISGATVTLGSTAGGTLGFRDDGVLVGYLNSSAEGTVLRAEGNRDLSILTNSTDRITIKGDGKVGVGTTTPKNNLDVNGSFGRGTMVKTAATTYTVAENDTYILLTASSNVTVTLPSASTWTRREIMIRSYGGDKAVNSASSNVEFDGTVGTSILPSGTKYALLVSDGTNWVVITRSLN
jgi:hypothetical protein